MKKLMDKYEEQIKGIAFIFLMWAIVSNGMRALVGDSAFLWGALIVGIALLAIHIYYKEKENRYNKEKDMNKYDLYKHTMLQSQLKDQLKKRDQGGKEYSKKMIESFNASLRKEKKADWGDELRDAANEALRKGHQPY
jgi:hypothetical protein